MGRLPGGLFDRDLAICEERRPQATEVLAQLPCRDCPHLCGHPDNDMPGGTGDPPKRQLPALVRSFR